MNAEQKQRALTALGMWRSNNDGSLREYQAAELMASLLQEIIDAPDAEPFGYFKAEPFGWTDCAETDEGAIALYEHPPAPSVPAGWRQFLTDVITAAGLLKYGKRDKGLADRIGSFAFDAMRAAAPPPQMLSDERIKELSDMYMNMYGFDDVAFARAIEREILGGEYD